jgi:class 3 adenylate cyclase/predicted ATPase
MLVIDEKSFYFEGYTLDLRRGCLRQSDCQVELRPKSFAVLRYLVENAGRLVPKDELITAVWATVTVTDVSLARCISDVRLALQDTAQAIIKTVPRRGYLFAAPVFQTPSASLTADRALGDTSIEDNRGEARQLTVMACEFVGLVTLSPHLDPEDLREAAASCRRRCVEIIERCHGYVARCAGDSLVAYFGFPKAREQDPENSVRAALILQRLGADFGVEHGMRLQPCIGIATGIVVIGGESAASATEQTATGGAVSLSGRLQVQARPGQILINDSTKRLIGGLFEYRDLGDIALKGVATPIAISQVLGESNIENRFEAYHPANLVPLVGRDEEIELVLRRWRQAKDGVGSVVMLAGEAGIGKSRVIRTVLDLLDTEEQLSLFCSSHRQDSALHPFITQLARSAGFRQGDTDEERLVKLEATLGRAAEERRDAIALLAELLSVPTGDRYPSLNLTPQKRKERTLQGLVAHIEALATSSPLLLTIEDVHWADPTSLELIDLIVEQTPSLRMLVMVTFRPEFTPPWAGRIQTTSITLGRLSPGHCAEIVAGVVHGKGLPKVIVDTILERADGVPLFVEELTKAVIESGALADAGGHYTETRLLSATEIPVTLHGSLLARLDRLGSGREVAQIGAALGRRFSHQVISALGLIPQEALDAALTRLVGAELVWRRGVSPDAEYTFKHALVQDAAYGTLLREQRRTLHGRIAKTLESQFPDLSENQPELLAHHCTEAGLVEKAIGFWGKAGQLSLAHSALKEAVVQLGRALTLIESLPSTAALRREQINLQVSLANALMHTKGYAAPETKRALDLARSQTEKAESLGETPEDPLLLFSVLHGFWVANHVAFNGDLVRELADQFMAFAVKLGDTFPLVLAHRVAGTSSLFLGDIVDGRAHLDRAMSLYQPAAHRPLGTRFGQEVGVAILSNRPLALWLLGHPKAALEDADNALRYARDVGQTASYLYALTRIAWIQLVIGNYEVAAVQTKELMAIAEEMEGSYWTAAGMMLQGCLFALTGKGSAAIDLITAGIGASRLKGANLLRMPWYFSCLAQAHVELGQVDEARRCVSEAMMAMETTKETWQEADIYRIAGELLLMSPEQKARKGQAHLERALEIARAQKARSWELRAATSLARLWRGQGKRRQAADLLSPIYGWFTEGFDTPDLKQAQALLAELA